MKLTTLNGIIVCLIFLFAAGCTKTSPSVELRQNTDESRLFNPPGCRLTAYDYYDNVGNVGTTDRFSYKNGLLDVWETFYGFTYKLKYDQRHKLTSADAYSEGVLVNIIHFRYKNNKVVREEWYDASTHELADDVRYTYNLRGEMLQGESVLLGYATKYTYFADGSMRSWQVLQDGLPASKSEYTYHGLYRNPYRSIDGLDYCFAYTNSNFGIGLGPRWYASEKVILYDESGNPYTYYDQKPGKTKWDVGDQLYPIFADYTDGLTGLHITNGFQYENCKSCWLPFSKNNVQSSPSKPGSLKSIKRIRTGFANPNK